MLSETPSEVVPGLDRLERGEVGEALALLRDGRVGLLTNPTGVTRQNRSALAVLRAAGVEVRALFAPEHGPRADLEGEIASGEQEGIPVHSLYGQTRRPTQEMLAGLSAVAVDIQDVGARFYTYGATLLALLEECAPRGIDLVILDRPNPLGAAREGPVIDEDLRSFVGPAPLPVTHGLTLGELGRFFAWWRELSPPLVVPVAGWRDRSRWEGTGLPWRAPSPNLGDFETAAWYPGLCLLEFCDLSVGRGTPAPFRTLSAPDFPVEDFLHAWQNAGFDEPIEAWHGVPSRGAHENALCHGVRWTGSAPVEAVEWGLRVLATLRRAWPGFERERWDKCLPLLGSRALSEALWNARLDEAIEMARTDARDFSRLVEREAAIALPDYA